ncbi:MAG: hypothetical protein GX620_02730 [Chloroflexi bacterium]|nr:hypothetical protein [Chloroflexota bacterium]
MTDSLLGTVESLLKRRWVNWLLVLAGIGLALLVVARSVYVNWDEFRTFEWQVAPWPLVGAGIALAAAFCLNLTTWHLISGTLGSRLGFLKNAEIYSFATVIRRLPGVVWQLAGRTYLYHLAETSLVVPVWGTLWEVFAQFASGIALTVLTLVLSPRLQNHFPTGTWALLLLIPVVWLLARPQDAIRLAARLAPKYASHELRVRRRDVWGWVAMYLLSWALGGVILHLLISAIRPQSWMMLGVCVGLVSATGVLSLLATPIPGGLGIRDVSLLILLQLYVESPVAVGATVTLRLMLLLGEALVALCTYLVVRWIVAVRARWANTP